MFSSSSGQRRRLNADGSVAVFCSVCGEFISNTFNRIGSATCELCRRVLAGEELTEEAIRTYRMARGSRGDVSLLLVPQELQPDAQLRTLRSLGGDIVHALGFLKPVKHEPQSAQVSKGKRRSALFENIDPGSSLDLGSMIEMDKELNKQREGE